MKTWLFAIIINMELMTFLLCLKGWSSFTTGASKIASAAKEGVSK